MSVLKLSFTLCVIRWANLVCTLGNDNKKKTPPPNSIKTDTERIAIFLNLLIGNTYF